MKASATACPPFVVNGLLIEEVTTSTLIPFSIRMPFAFLDCLVVILNNGIIKKYTASPLTYRDYTGTPMGSAYGIVKDCRNPLVTLFPAKTRINNLLLTGQNLNIHGCLGTTISAAITCAEILGMSYMAKAIGNA